MRGSASCELGQFEKRIGGRMAGPDHQRRSAGVEMPVAAEDIRNAIGDPIGELGFALGRQDRSRPSGFGVVQVPEASMTARARSRRMPSFEATARTKGRFSRPRLTTLSRPCREIAVTRAPVSITAASSGVAASGSR